ncbi:ORF67 [Ranid herpesvirus 2]|uniref:ORF67 n=1 Tax=Ranid herpesvirus 2 TaxID=389214 RepID=Q14W39_9VIRU|nr:ORF67 [Ranid herpesvirus 2]ABG25662.1 ORF67 [Ranid herpesvirus 2]
MTFSQHFLLPQSSRRAMPRCAAKPQIAQILHYQDQQEASEHFNLNVKHTHFGMVQAVHLLEKSVMVESITWLDKMTEPVEPRRMCRDICSALHYLQTFWVKVHGSIDPSCIGYSECTRTYKLFDRSLQVLELNSFRAPEQLMPKRHIHASTDLWSLAVVTALYVLDAPLFPKPASPMELYSNQIILCGLPQPKRSETPILVDVPNTVLKRFEHHVPWQHFFFSCLVIDPECRPKVGSVAQAIPPDGPVKCPPPQSS